MKICVLCSGFPTKKSAASIFVVKLCEQWADQGHTVTIVATQSITKTLVRKVGHTPKAFTYTTREGRTINVYRPKTISFSRIPLLKQLAVCMRRKAITNVIKKVGNQDAFYCHFWDNGYSLYKAIGKQVSPLIVASGESVINFRCNDEGFRQTVSGVVCVSTKNMEESINLGLTTREKCIVLPNAIDTTIFHKMDKQQCRRELGIDPKLFVVIYVGQFLHRKGYDRLAAAIDKLDDPQIGVVFLGMAKEGKEPQCRGIIHRGFTSQNVIAKYLNAADVFVLPTQAEGCCNAIVEAMACGLPIISSDLPFNHDILDSNNAVLIDPNDIEGIAIAIQKIKNAPVQQVSMSRYSLEKAQRLTLPMRATKIMEFIKTSSKK